jgi:proteasome activator subunit 4
MKTLRNIKLRTFCLKSTDLVVARNHNPLKQRVLVKPSHSFTNKFLDDFKIPFDGNSQNAYVTYQPRFSFIFIIFDKFRIFSERALEGWLAWKDTISLYKPAHPTKSTFQPWDIASEDVVKAVREFAVDTSFWKTLSGRYSEENHESVIVQDNVSCVKSICK